MAVRQWYFYLCIPSPWLIKIVWDSCIKSMCIPRTHWILSITHCFCRCNFISIFIFYWNISIGPLCLYDNCLIKKKQQKNKKKIFETFSNFLGLIDLKHPSPWDSLFKIVNISLYMSHLFVDKTIKTSSGQKHKWLST